MQRHTGGGIAARTIACLPALVGAWRDAAGGIVLSTADFYGFDHAALERADLLAGRRPRVINQSQLGDALTTAQPPVRAMIVYNNRSEEHTSELQSQSNLVCRLLLEKKKNSYAHTRRHTHD